MFPTHTTRQIVSEILDRPDWETTAPPQESESATSCRNDGEAINGSNSNNVESSNTGATGAEAGTTANSTASARGNSRDTCIQERQGGGRAAPGGTESDQATSTQLLPQSSHRVELVRRLTVELPVDSPSPDQLRHKVLPPGEENGGKSSTEQQEGGEKAAAVDLLREGPVCRSDARVMREGECVGGMLGAEVGVKCPLPSAESALNLRDGGFAPGEEGCGRDEEL